MIISVNRWIQNLLVLKFFLWSALLSATEFSRQPPCPEALATVLKHFESVRRDKIATKDSWPIDGPPNHLNGMAYEEHFSDFIKPFDSFYNFLKARRALGKRTHVLDLFGSAVFVNNESADSLTGVSLMLKYPAQANSNREVITGNLYDDDIWPLVEQRMARLKIFSFDLITMRPLGAVSPLQQFRWDESFTPTFPGELSPEVYAFGHLYFKILEKAYNLLIKDRGYLLFQLPHIGFYNEKYLGPWLSKLYENENDPKFSGGYGRIVKNSQSGPLPIP